LNHHHEHQLDHSLLRTPTMPKKKNSDAIMARKKANKQHTPRRKADLPSAKPAHRNNRWRWFSGIVTAIAGAILVAIGIKQPLPFVGFTAPVVSQLANGMFISTSDTLLMIL
jgi:hypothetical protein